MLRLSPLSMHAVIGLATMSGVFGMNAPSASLVGDLGLFAAPSPAQADLPAERPVATPGTATDIMRAEDGLFYVNALVNGRPVRFLIDTGANVVMLTRADAQRVGATFGEQSFDSSVATANGASAMAWTTLRRITVAGHALTTVSAAVPESGLPVSLLGQNALSRLGHVIIDGDRMRVIPGPSAAAGDTARPQP